MIKNIIDKYFANILINEIIKDLKVKTFYNYEYRVVKNKYGLILLCNRVNNEHYITIYKLKYKDAPCIYCHSFFKTSEEILQAVRIYYEGD